jgi:ankyrin repeat protein
VEAADNTPRHTISSCVFAVFEHDNTVPCAAVAAAEVLRLVDAGTDINEVEAAGNTPLHSAAFEGWAEGMELLLQLGAKVNARQAAKLHSMY